MFSFGKREPPPLPRFVRGDRVVCNVGDRFGWLAGIVADVNKVEPEYDNEVSPYVVRLDPPISKSITVPYDENRIVIPEVCLDESKPGSSGFALCCAPAFGARRTAHKRRFAAGERVVVAVEDSTDCYSDWAAGTVIAVDYPLEFPGGLPEGMQGRLPPIPYRVTLDAAPETDQHGFLVQHYKKARTCGRTVLVHRDEHWLIRDLKLQDPGPRQRHDFRALSKLTTRKITTAAGGEAWEKIDHGTRFRHPCRPPEPDSD